MTWHLKSLETSDKDSLSQFTDWLEKKKKERMTTFNSEEEAPSQPVLMAQSKEPKMKSLRKYLQKK